jgi:hypothetical protein
MNFPDQNTSGNKGSRRSMSPSRNRELEVVQAGIRRSYVKDHAMNEKTVRQPSRNFLQGLAQIFINLTRT